MQQTEGFHTDYTDEEHLDTATATKLVNYRAEGWLYFPLWIKMYIFSVFTLGIYYFWGKTNMRRYLWSHTEVLDSRLEYTGTGKELFLGFLFVIPLLILINIISTGAQFFADELILGAASFVIFLGMLWFTFFAIYRALRYRLTRTRWHGIRGNMLASGVTYANKCMLYSLAAVLSLGLLTPWAMVHIIRLRTDDMVFGNMHFTFTGKAKDLYFILAKATAIFLVILASLGGLFFFIGGDHIFGSITAAFVAWSATILYFSGAKARWFYSNLWLGDSILFTSELSMVDWIRVNLTYGVLLLVTLGFAWPFYQIAKARLIFDSLYYYGELDLAHLTQDTREGMERGEGLATAFDIDVGFGF